MREPILLISKSLIPRSNRRFILPVKTLLFSLLLNVISLVSFGQTKSELIGTWKVQKVNFLEEISLNGEMKEKMNMLQKALVHSVFYFHKDEKFNYKIEISDLQIENGHWHYDPNTKYISINEWEDREKPGGGGLMGIFIRKDRMGRTLFQISESPFILVMDKE